MIKNNKCNCQICLSGLSDYVNSLATKGNSIKSISEKLLTVKRLKTDGKTIKNHLDVYNIEIGKTPVLKGEIARVNIDLNEVSFDENFDDTDIQSVIGYLQKIYLRIHLNSSKILLDHQEKYFAGESEDIPEYALKSFAISHKIFSESTGMTTIINLNAAIRIVENAGYRLQ